MFQKQIGKNQAHVLVADPSGDIRGQALSRVFVDDAKNQKWPAIVCPIRHEIIRPDVMAVGGPPSEARPIGAP